MRYQTLIDGRLSSHDLCPAIDRTVDAVVVGLGTAGSVALIAAAKMGLRVLGIERGTAMGGLGTTGGIWHYYFGQTGGVREEILRRCADLDALGAYVAASQTDETGSNYSAVVKCLALDRMAEALGAEILYETIPVGVFMEGATLVGIRVFSDGKLLNVSSRCVIDASGYGAVARLAGCAMQRGRASDGGRQLSSKAWGILDAGGTAEGRYTAFGRADILDPDAYSRASLEAMLSPNASCDPTQGRCFWEAPALSSREGHAIVGMETVTLTDYAFSRPMKEPVFYAACHNDYGNRDYALEDEALHMFQGVCNLYSVPLTVPVPMGALIPKDVDGLLAAGSCMSIHHDAAGCVRMKRDMEKSGEAAATLAAIAIASGVPAREVPYAQLSERLRATGCLDDSQFSPWGSETFGRWRGPALRAPYGWLARYGDVTPPKAWSSAELERQLASEDPRLALWQCYVQPELVRERCERWTQSGETPTDNQILAMGIAACPRALPHLRTMAFHGDDGTAKPWEGDDCTMRMRAVFLLGRMGDADSLPILMEILRAPLPHATPDSGAGDRKSADLAAALFLEAETALLRVLFAHPQHSECGRELQSLLHAPGFSLRFQLGNIDLTPAARALAMTL